MGRRKTSIFVHPSSSGSPHSSIFIPTSRFPACNAAESLRCCKQRSGAMTSKQIDSLNEGFSRANWGDSNVECVANEEEIRDLLRKKWPIKAIWRKLHESGSVSVKYEAFRKAAVRLYSDNDAPKHAEPERPKPKPSEQTAETPPTNQSRKPRYAEAAVEGLQFNYD
jgi:hypothetical protein